MESTSKILTPDDIRAIEKILNSGRTVKISPTKEGARIMEVWQRTVRKTGEKPVDRQTGT